MRSLLTARLKIPSAILSAMLLLASSSSWPAFTLSPALSANDEVEYFIKYFSDKSQVVSKEVYGQLEFSGITDTRLFDIVEQRFIEESKAKSAAAIDHLAWLSKALAYSGQSKYLDTLKTALKSTNNVKLKKYLEESIERSPLFSVWNVDISRDTANLRGEDLYRKRVLNMLRSSDSFLVMFGAKRVWFHHPTDSEFVRVASERLMETYNRPNPTVRDVDAIGWLCNVLGKASNPEYKPLLEKIIKESKNSRIVHYAKMNLHKIK